MIDLPLVHRKTEGGDVRLNTETLEVNTSASTVAVDEVEELPTAIHLDQNYPNPFNPTTTIAFELSQPQEVRLEVFDLLGRRVALLLDESRVTGRHQVRFDARDLASGLYVYRLVAGSVVKARTMVVVK